MLADSRTGSSSSPHSASSMSPLAKAMQMCKQTVRDHSLAVLPSLKRPVSPRRAAAATRVAVDELPPVGERLLYVDTDVGVQANPSALTIPTPLTGRARNCLYTPRLPRTAR